MISAILTCQLLSWSRIYSLIFVSPIFLWHGFLYIKWYTINFVQSSYRYLQSIAYAQSGVDFKSISVNDCNTTVYLSYLLCEKCENKLSPAGTDSLITKGSKSVVNNVSVSIKMSMPWFTTNMIQIKPCCLKI